MRSGLLALELAVRGHDVVWWTSRFDHTQKRHRRGPTVVAAGDHIRIRLVDSPGYVANISARRWIDHAVLAGRFFLASSREPTPDCIVTSLPPTELALAAVSRRAVYRVVDIRDKWPDVLLEGAGWNAWLLRLGATVIGASAKSALRRADAVWAHAPAFLSWGLERAGRAEWDGDAVFPHGYVDEPIDANDQARASAFWSSKGLDRPADRFVFSGALSRQFDFDTVVAAADALRGEGRNIELIFCGTGEREAGLRAAATTRPWVKVVGFVDRPTLWHALDRSVAGLAPYISTPSFMDSMPNKIIEYFARRCSVVSSLDGHSRRVLEDAGIGAWYPSGDPAALLGVLRSLLDAPAETEAAGHRARSLFEREYAANLVYPAMARRLEDAVKASR